MAFVKIPAATNRTIDFTSSGTWTCPSGVYSAEFLVVGAGGGGGGCAASSATFYVAGGGGGGGAVKKVIMATIPGNNYTITIGAKGTGGSATSGTNGGFSEILLSGTTLIRSFGGQGGAGVTALDAVVLPTLSRTIAGGGGTALAGSTSGNRYGGGGGGAGSGDYNRLSAEASNNSLNYGGEGGRGFAGSTTVAQSYAGFGGNGIDGYGAGGSGGCTISSSTNYNASGNSYFAGVGAYRETTGTSNGGNAVANTGCGGGGAANFTNTTAASGGNGADGLVRITYFA